MAQPDSGKRGEITLDELIALNDEIAALVRAGVPLEQGLAELGSDMPGRLGSMATLLAERAGRGEPLLLVLAEQSNRLPPLYRAVVEAGVRAGRLPAALEALATSVRRLAETRRSIMAAAIYPVLVLMLACALFAFFSRAIVPTLSAAFKSFGVPGRFLLEMCNSWGHWAVYWGTLLPLAILLLAAVWWHQSRRAALLGSRRSGFLLGWFPWVSETLQCSRTATFAEVLALLVESGVPLPTGVVLAAEASGDSRLLAAAKQLAEQLARGEVPGEGATAGLSGSASGATAGLPSSASGATAGLPSSAAFPPLLAWLMSAGQRQGALLPALKHAAETYHRRAQHQADLLRILLPVTLTVTLGGSVTALYALALFWPYTSMLRSLAKFY